MRLASCQSVVVGWWRRGSWGGGLLGGSQSRGCRRREGSQTWYLSLVMTFAMTLGAAPLPESRREASVEDSRDNRDDGDDRDTHAHQDRCLAARAHRGDALLWRFHRGDSLLGRVDGLDALL